MKKIKVSMVAVIAIVIALAGSAFTMKSNVKKLDDTYYFQFNSDRSEDLMDPDNWSAIDSRSEGCLQEEELPCTIQVTEPPVNGKPNFSALGYDDPADLEPVTITYKEEATK